MIGETRHPLYITFDTPIGNGPYNETCVWLGCTAARGKTTEESVFNAIWNKFQSMNVTTRDGRQLGYYKAGAQTSGIFTTDGLLQNGDGRCGAWADFTNNIFNSQGINSSTIHYKHIAGDINHTDYKFIRNGVEYKLNRISQRSIIYQNGGSPNSVNFIDHAFNKVSYITENNILTDAYIDTTCKNDIVYNSAQALIENTIYLKVIRTSDNVSLDIPAIFNEFYIPTRTNP